MPRLTRYLARLAPCILPLLLGACAETPRVTPTPVTLRIVASSTLAPALHDAARPFRADYAWITLQEEALNSAGALDRLSSGGADLAFVSWLPADLDPGLWRSALALDAVAVIVHPANPVSGLSLAQLRDVFQGRVLDWSAFGWEAQDLIVVSREDGSGTRAAFEDAVTEGRAVTRNAIVEPDSDAVVAYVARTPGAIGYVSRGRLSGAVKAIAVEGVEPTPSNVANNTYPIGRALYVVARSEPGGATRDFVAWLLESGGQSLLAQRGFGRVK